jgi:hypothetical protein
MRRGAVVLALTLVCAGATLAGQRSPQPLPTGTSVLSGRVVEIAERPLAGALVTVLHLEHRFGASGELPGLSHTAVRGGDNRLQDAKTLTDADGRYAFSGLPPGRYVVVASKHGFATAIRGMPELLPTNHPVELERDQKLAIDFALARGGSIRGRVVDQSGRPFNDMRVLVNILRDTGAPGMMRSVEADASGTYRFEDLPSGSFRIAASVLPRTNQKRDPYVIEFTPQTTFYPGVADIRQATWIAVNAGAAVEGIDIVALPPDSVSISGRVVGSSVTDVDFSIRRAIGSTITAVRVNSEGAFTVSRLQRGRYVLVAKSVSESGTEAAVLPIDVDADLTDIEVAMAPAGRISGRVVTEPGSVLAVAGMRIAAILRDGQKDVDPLRRDEVDIAPDGAFALEGLIGERVLRVSGLPSGWWVGWIEHRGVKLAAFDVGPGADYSAVTVVLVTR